MRDDNSDILALETVRKPASTKELRRLGLSVGLPAIVLQTILYTC